MALPKVQSATSFREDLYETLKEVSEGAIQMLTHKQGEPVMLVSKTQYEKLLDENEAFRKMAIGLAQINAGKGIPHKKAVKTLQALKKKWK